jgi:hypothetical protein
MTCPLPDTPKLPAENEKRFSAIYPQEQLSLRQLR